MGEFTKCPKCGRDTFARGGFKGNRNKGYCHFCEYTGEWLEEVVVAYYKIEEKKIIEMQELLSNAKSEMDYWNDHTESDECIFNQSDLWERRYKTLCEVMEIINR